MFLIKTPVFLPWIYPHLIWKIRSENEIYITFDDGPIPEVTPFVISSLNKFNAKATFFCIGDNVRKHPGIYREILRGGHSVGNHTFNHLKGWKTDDRTYLENYIKCATVVNSNLFRPPYGRIKKSQISKLRNLNPHIRIVMWHVLSGDFSVNLSPEKCLKNVLDNVGPGSIVVFHDSLKAFERLKYALPLALKYWQEKGYTMAAL